MKKLYLVIFFLIAQFSFNAQQYTIKQIDSLVDHGVDLAKKSPGTAIFLNEKNYEISKKANHKQGMIKSMSALASCYFYTGNLKKAIQYAKQTTSEAGQINDYPNMCTGLSVSAMIYAKSGFDKESQQMMGRAFDLSKKIKSPDDFHKIKGDLYQTKVIILTNNGKSLTSPEILQYTKLAYAEFSKIKNSNIHNSTLASVYMDLGPIYADKKMFDSAFYYINKSLDLSKTNNNIYGESIAMYGLGYTSYQQKDYPKAVDYLEKAIPIIKNTKDPYLLNMTYRALQHSYMRLNNKIKEEEYLAKYSKLNDSLILVERAVVKVPLEEIVKEKENHFISEKNRFYIIIGIICLLFIIAFYFGYQSFANYKKEKKEKLQREIVLEEKSTQLIQLEQKINNAFEEVLELAKTDDSSFLTRFIEVYPDFIKKLNHHYPNLTSGQLKFCALLKLNFSTKEIAYYNHISPRSVEIKKGRLRKQLNIPSSEDLNKWMINL